MRWFRLYNEIVDDPKMLQLSDREFRIWIGLLSMASSGSSWGNLEVDLKTMSRRLRQDIRSTSKAIEHFKSLKMVSENGKGFQIINWEKRQFKSDSSYERVKRFRNVSVTANETPPEQSRTDTEQNNSCIKLPRNYETLFDKTWSMYPRKVNKQRAFSAWKARVRAGMSPENLQKAVEHYRCSRQGEEEKYTMHASTFFGPGEPCKEWINGPPEEQAHDSDDLFERYGYARSEVEGNETDPETDG